MTAARSVEGRDRLRLFCALTLPASVRARLETWQRSSLGCDARRVESSNLHLTLAFLGARPKTELGAVAEALREAVRLSERPIVLSPLRYRESRSVAMLVLADEHGRAEQLALALWERLEGLGVYEREARRWLPHVTVLRFRKRPLLRPSLPEISAFSPSDAAVYHSLLAPSGARYEVLESVSLGSCEMGG